MRFVRYTLGTAEKARVESFGNYTEQFPQDDENVVFVEDNYTFPNSESPVGKAAVLYINPSTKDMWYEYIDRPLTTEEQLKQIDSKMDNAILEITTLIFMGGM